MRGRTIVSGLLVLVLLSTSLVSGAGQTSTATTGHTGLPAEHLMSFTFDAMVAKVTCLGQQWDSFQLSGCEVVSSPGTPDLPARSLRLELPNPLSKASVSFGDVARYDNVRLVPAGAASTDGTDASFTGVQQIDSASYQKDTLLPALSHEVVSMGEGVNDAGQRFYAYDIILYPLRYNPARGEALLYQKCELGLYYDNTPHMLAAPRTGSSDQAYIILTDTAVNNSGALGPLLTWKTRKGLPAFSYDVNDIYANYTGWDNAEKIRNFLMSMYDGGNGSVRWVQIIGDTDAVPTREVANPNPIGSDDGWIATDTYYSCLDPGSTWDKNGNHIYGELLDTNHDGIYDYSDLDDSYPDVSVARFASSDIAKVTPWVSNAVTYDMGTNLGPWMNSCTLVAPNAGTMGTAAQVLTLMEQFVNKTGGFGGYLGPYYGKLISNGAINRLYEANGTLSSTSFINALNGGYALGTWIAQGDDNSFSSATPSIGTIFSSSNVAGLINGVAKPVIFAVSSDSGRFDGQECLGEALTENNLFNGAMGFIGPSRTTLASSNPGYWDNGNATGLLMDFLYALQLGRTTNATYLYMGETLSESKYMFSYDFGEMSEALSKAFYEYNLLGEVNSPIWTDQAGTFNVITTVSEDATYKNVSIWALNADGNHPMNHTLVCLKNDGLSYYQSIVTADDGYANFSIPKTMSLGDITVSRADFQPFTYDQVPLDDIYKPHTGINITPPNPDGKNGWYKTTPTVKLLPEAGSTTYWRWDDGNNQTYDTGVTVITVPEGTHHLYYHAVDWKNNTENEKDQSFSVDSSIPYSNITITPAAPDGQNGWYISQPLVTLTGFDNTSNPTVLFKEDSDTDFIGYVSPIPIYEGRHTLYYYSEDQAGNAEAQHVVTFKVDTTTPSSIATISPLKNDGLNGWYIKAPTISFTVSPPDENGPYIIYWWDNGAPANLTNVTTGGTLTPLQGIHTLYFRAADEAGNLENIQNLTIKLDSFVPVTNITADPALPDGLNGWYISQPTLTFDAGGDATTLYRWNQDSFANATGPVKAPEGTNTLSYYSVDDAGNKEMIRLAVYKVDTAVPVTSITVTPADKGDQWYTKRPSVRLNNSENASMFYYWGSDVTGMQNYTVPFPVPEGRELLHYWAMDIAGNKEQENTKDFLVDTVAPQPAITPSATSITEGDSVTFSLGGTDANGIINFSVDFGDGNSTGWVQVLTVNHTYTVAGNYTVICRAQDPAGNEGSAGTQVIEVRAKYIPPVVKPTQNNSGPNLLLIGAVVVILIVVCVVAVVAVRSRKGENKKEDFFLDQKKEAERKAMMPAYDFGTAGGAGEAGMAGSGAVAETAFAGAAPAAAESPPPTTPGSFNCPKCGNEVEAGADYCYTCGERFKKKGGGPGGAPPFQPQQQQAPRQTAYAPPQQEAPAYAPAQEAGQYQEPSMVAVGAAPADYGQAPAQPVYEEPARPAQPASAQRPAGGTGDLADIMSRLETISKPAGAAPATQPRPQAAPRPRPGAVPAPPPQRAAQPAWSQPAAAPAAPAAATASAETATGKMCPKCGTEMVRLVDLPGAQGEQLRKLNAKGQHAFQCRNCNNFLVAPWTPPR